MDADLLRIPVGPGSMHVERYGHGGAPILLVHGFGTFSFLWRGSGSVLATASRTAFALDLFGYGESDRPCDYESCVEFKTLRRLRPDTRFHIDAARRSSEVSLDHPGDRISFRVRCARHVRRPALRIQELSRNPRVRRSVAASVAAGKGIRNPWCGSSAHS